MGHSTRLTSALSVVAMAAMLGAAALPLAAQATGTVRGRVTDAATQRPLSGAQISLAGTTRRAVTNSTGDYTLANVPAGSLTVRAELLGYGAGTQSVNVAAGQTATANFELSTRSIALDALVVTGTPGATQRRQLGNAVSQVNAAEITDKVPVSSVAQLLQSRSPGLNITTGSGTSGTAANITIRGLSSVYGGNRPLVYVDGVRVNAGTYDIGSGGQDYDVLQNMNPDDIESVEVIKGPAAATLYGSEAAAGVIQIITKKGQVGDQQVQFSAKGELGRSDWNAWMPTNYYTCDIARVRNGLAYQERPTNANGAFISWYPGCAAVDTLSQNPRDWVISGMALRDYVRDGQTRNLDVSARGGGEQYSYYIAGSRSEDDGIFPTEFSNRTTMRGNFFVQPRDNMDIGVNMSLSRTDRGLPENDNNSWGYLRNAYRGRPGVLFNTGWDIGWLGLSPRVISTVENTFQTDQLLLSTTANWQPFNWFRNRLTVGVDASNNVNSSFFAKDQTGRAPFGNLLAQGYISTWMPEARDYTIDYAGTVTFELPREVSSTFSFGMQYTGERDHAYQTIGMGLPFRPIRLVDRANTTQAYETYSAQNTVGIFLQEQLGWKDRLFLTGAVRFDDNSAFGGEYDYQAYPKVSGSYVISEESFFNFSWVDHLKLRGAWGRAGTSPAPFAADRTYNSTPIVLMNDASSVGLVPGNFGNAELKPEIGTELELGLDASFLNDRFSLEATYYNTRTDDLLMNVPVPPSSGFAGSIQTNLGEVSNSGIELGLNATPVQSRAVRWESRVAFSTNKNRMVSFDGARDEPIRHGYGTTRATQQIREGYPLGGYWTQDVMRNPDGSVQLGSNGLAILDTAIYIGPSQPTRLASLTNTFTVLGNVQLYTFLDYKGGHYLYNMVQQARDANGVSWEYNNPDATDEDLGVRFSGSDLAYIQKADFVRLREVSLTYTVPNSLLGRFGTDALSLSLAGRNLALWSKYPGSDPEVNVEGGGTYFTRADFYSVPNLRQFVATVNVRF